MKTKIFAEKPVYRYAAYNGDPIEIYREEAENIKVGDTWTTEDWDPETNATSHYYVTVKCIYCDKNGFLLKEQEEEYYNNLSGSGKREEVSLVWVELHRKEEAE